MFGVAATRTDVLTAIGAVLTALITGGILVLSLIAYKHSRTLAGRRKPIVTARTTDTQFMYAWTTKSLPAYVDKDHKDEARLGYVHMFNHSDSDQFISFRKRTRIVWPRLHGVKLVAVAQGVFLPAHEGGSVPIVLQSNTGQWPADTLDDDGQYRRNYWAVVRGSTMGLRKVKYRGRVWLTPYESKSVPRLHKD
jgi:hypothetical protein